MKKTRNSPINEQNSNEDQTEAYLFVGKFISDFANLEMIIEKVIISYFMIDPTLSIDRRKEIFDKNISVSSIMEYSILGSAYFSFQMKVEMVKSIIQETTPLFYAKHGNVFFDLITRLQNTRNLVAHYKTYVFEGNVSISKPKTKIELTKGNTGKGGVTPDPIAEYEMIYKTSVITDEIKVKIGTQISFVKNVVSLYFITNHHSSGINPNLLEDMIKIENLYKGGVYDLEILK